MEEPIGRGRRPVGSGNFCALRAGLTGAGLMWPAPLLVRDAREGHDCCAYAARMWGWTARLSFADEPLCARSDLERGEPPVRGGFAAAAPAVVNGSAAPRCSRPPPSQTRSPGRGGRCWAWPRCPLTGVSNGRPNLASLGMRFLPGSGTGRAPPALRTGGL